MRTILEILLWIVVVGLEFLVLALIAAPKAVLRRARDLALALWRGAANLVRRLGGLRGRFDSARPSRS
jgi:hypothetical protein